MMIDAVYISLAALSGSIRTEVIAVADMMGQNTKYKGFA